MQFKDGEVTNVSTFPNTRMAIPEPAFTALDLGSTSI